MCGICGIYNYNKQPVSEDSIIRMREILTHRGPDDKGIFVDKNIGLGHRRLKVIDLKTGRQPMMNEDKSIVLVFNGELYNYIELKKKFLLNHKFQSTSDTEVIIHMYEEFGIKCLEYFNGMFAFALWDSYRKKLFIVRDHFGIKPLYYYKDKTKFVFASEIKSILKADIKCILNNEVLFEYLTFQYYTDENTLFKNIYRVSPGHYLEINANKVVEKCYRDININEDKKLTETDCKETLNYLINDSVKMQLRSDVALGCHLSGGIDTGIIASLASKYNKRGNRIKSFTAYFGKNQSIYNDTYFAQKTAAFNKTDMYKIKLTKKDFFDSLKNIFYHLDEPCAGEGAVPQYYVSQLASKQVTVVLGGQGADEMFGGYARYFILYFSYLLEKKISNIKLDPSEIEFEMLSKSLLQLKNYKNMFFNMLKNTQGMSYQQKYFFLIDRMKNNKNLLNKDFIKKTKQYNPIYRMSYFFDKNKNTSLLNKILYYEMKTWLPALLNIEDKLSMKWSLESRVPFLDYRICDLAFKIPANIKLKNGILKYILKESMKKNISPQIYARKDKIGFPVPLFKWQKDINIYIQNLIKKCDYTDYLFNKNLMTKFKNQNIEFDRWTWGLISILNWFNIFKPQIR